MKRPTVTPTESQESSSSEQSSSSDVQAVEKTPPRPKKVAQEEEEAPAARKTRQQTLKELAMKGPAVSPTTSQESISSERSSSSDVQALEKDAASA